LPINPYKNQKVIDQNYEARFGLIALDFE
jgi:hypothetical protein